MASKKQIIGAAKGTDAWLKAKQKLHITMIQNSTKKLQKNILDSLNVLSMSPTGKIDGIKVNLGTAQKLQKTIQELFYKDFNSHTKKIIKDFQTAQAQITQNFKMIGEAAKFTDVDQTMMSVLRDGYYQDYVALGDTYKNKVVQSVYDNVIGNGQFSDLVNEINGALVGTAAKGVTGAALSQYANLYARDMIMNFHNEVTLKKADELGMDTFIYTGTIMGKTRPFCRKRVGNPYTKKKINSWKFKWKGKSGPAMTNRGGYNCRHHWQPVRKEWLDDKEMSMLDQTSILDKDGMPIPPKLKPKPKPKAKPLKPKPIKAEPKPKTGQDWQGDMWPPQASKWNAGSLDKKTYYVPMQTGAIDGIGPKVGMPTYSSKYGVGVNLYDKKAANALGLKGTPSTKLVKLKTNIKKPLIIKDQKHWKQLESDMKKVGYDPLKSAEKAAYFKKVGYDAIDVSKISTQQKLIVLDTKDVTMLKGSVLDIKKPKVTIKPIPKVLPKPEPIIKPTKPKGIVVDSPAMYEGNASIWAKQGTDSKVYYYSNKLSSMDKINTEGLLTRVKKINGITYGEGVFLSNKKVADQIAKNIGSGGTVVKAHIKVNKIKKIKNFQEWEKIQKAAAKKGLPFTVGKPENIAKYFKKYDAIDISKLYPKKGGLLVFDKKKTTFVKGSISKPKVIKKPATAAEVKAVTTQTKVLAELEKLKKNDYTGGKLDATAKLFKNKVDGHLYMQKKRMYSDWFKYMVKEDFAIPSLSSGVLQNTKVLLKHFKEDMPNVYSMMSSWQASTNNYRPMAYRLKYTMMEKKADANKLIWKSSLVKKDVLANVDKYITSNDYITVRAINQAYMEVKGIKSSTLFRGTDGRTGKKILGNIKTTGKVKRNSIPIEDRQLAGYSSSKKIGGNFGADSSGITMRQTFKTEEVLIHPDLLKGVTDSYRTEMEYIVRSQKRNVKVKDLWWDTKQFGEEM